MFMLHPLFPVVVSESFCRVYHLRIEIPVPTDTMTVSPGFRCRKGSRCPERRPECWCLTHERVSEMPDHQGRSDETDRSLRFPFAAASHRSRSTSRPSSEGSRGSADSPYQQQTGW